MDPFHVRTNFLQLQLNSALIFRFQEFFNKNTCTELKYMFVVYGNCTNFMNVCLYVVFGGYINMNYYKLVLLL